MYHNIVTGSGDQDVDMFRGAHPSTFLAIPIHLQLQCVQKEVRRREEGRTPNG